MRAVCALMLTAAVTLAGCGPAAPEPAPQARVSGDATQLAGQVLTLTDGIRRVFGGNNSYGGVSNDTVIGNRIAPADTVFGPTELRHALGGPIYTRGAGEGSALFAITLGALPQAACMQVVGDLYERAQFVSVGIAAGERTSVPQSMPMNLPLQDAVSQCAVADTVSVAFFTR